MIIQSGSKSGKSTQELFLKEPDWVYFFVGKNPDSKLAEEFRRHDRALTKKAFLEQCSKCTDRATCMSVYNGNAKSVMFWCTDCDPYSQGARSGMLSLVNTFKQANTFVDRYCGGKREDKRSLVRRLAEAKGLPKRVGANAAEKFLG
jgi:hypothetical protein